VSVEPAAWGSPVLAGCGGEGDGGSAKPSSCSLVLVLSLTSMAAPLLPQLPRWLSDALLWGAGGVFLRSSSPAAWGGLLRSPRPDRMGVGHPLRCFTASSAPLAVLPQVACSPVVIRRPWCADLRRRRGGRLKDRIALLRFS
jgi:hypothetical protein